jgi:predicted nucleic acid-binding protein
MTFSVGQGVVIVDASVAIEMVQGNDIWLGRWAAWIGADDLILVPPHFPFEVANALVRGLRLGADQAERRLERLDRTGVQTADRGLDGLRDAVRLAERHGLTVYDAAYLELAIDVDGLLATLDGDLRKAAEAEGIAVVG